MLIPWLRSSRQIAQMAVGVTVVSDVGWGGSGNIEYLPDAG